MNDTPPLIRGATSTPILIGDLGNVGHRVGLRLDR